MTYDHKTWSWQFDIRSFERCKTMLNNAAHHQGEWADKYRAHLRERMTKIQQTWPQFIKVDEIP